MARYTVALADGREMSFMGSADLNEIWDWARPGDGVIVLTVQATAELPGGRAPGEGHATAKLTWSQVREIRQRQAGGERMANLARTFGVDRSIVRRIVRGELWREDGPK